ncbi:hypothetical protein GA0070616_4361 [Micromonospora nigra]|uniref:Uncharacterized protein n=2 Tax=Micromonospora nigra TaxID=145857 RepID=A0A1C6SQS4_9ACTN|nr:hypothetical protein GA0070616_4361 [Micromonospora nigra]
MGRSRPTLPYRLLVDVDGAEQARQRLERAAAAARQARLAERGLDEALAEVDAAQAELDGCYETIVLRALPLSGTVTVETLTAEHPPTEAQMAEAKVAREKARAAGDPVPPWPAWNVETFQPALLAASAPDAGMSPDDWASMLGTRMSAGEVRGLWAACMAINLTGRAAEPVVLPKGWTTTRS